MLMIKISLLVFAFIQTIYCAPLWGQSRISQFQNLNVADRHGPLGPPEVKWEFPLDGSNSAPVVDELGNVYIRSGDVIYSVNGDTGLQLWKSVALPTLFTPQGSVQCIYDIALSYTSSLVYSICTDLNGGNFGATVVALDAATGASAWVQSLTLAGRPSPLTVSKNDLLYFTANFDRPSDGKQRAFAIAFDTTGKMVWNATSVNYCCVEENAPITVASDDKLVWFGAQKNIECHYGPLATPTPAYNETLFYNVSTEGLPHKGSFGDRYYGDMNNGFLLDETKNWIIAATDDFTEGGNGATFVKIFKADTGDFVLNWERESLDDANPVIYEPVSGEIISWITNGIGAGNPNSVVGQTVRNSWVVTDLIKSKNLYEAERISGFVVTDKLGFIYIVQQGYDNNYGANDGRLISFDSSGVLVWETTGPTSEWYFDGSGPVLGKDGEMFVSSDISLMKFTSTQVPCPRGYTGADCDIYDGSKCCNTNTPLGTCGSACNKLGIDMISFTVGETTQDGFIQQGSSKTAGPVAPWSEVKTVPATEEVTVWYSPKNEDQITIFFSVLGYDYSCDVTIGTSETCSSADFQLYGGIIYWDVRIKSCSGKGCEKTIGTSQQTKTVTKTAVDSNGNTITVEGTIEVESDAVQMKIFASFVLFFVCFALLF